MSFRNRLGLFFLLIVIVPMVAVAVLLFGLLGKSEQSMGKADVVARQQVVTKLYVERQREADRKLTLVGKDDVFATAVQTGDVAAARKRAEELLKIRDIERIVLFKNREVLLKAGDKTAIAPMVRRLETNTTPAMELGVLGVSVVDARTFAKQVQRLTGLEIVVTNGSKLLATTFAEGRAPTALPGDDRSVKVGGTTYRTSAFGSGFPGQKVRIATFGTPAISSSVGSSRLVIGAILFGFLLLALACAVLVSRSLQQQLAAFLDAAKRLAGGDFSAKVTTVGNDEFAGLGEEFNKMSGELERRLVELQQERERVQNSMRSLGEAVASKL
ncbi:MAG: HAMP domain-containing protein, partial [Solirubrobacterales bacterium]|nr:HAMP domain-containing protein [Solirubrobacterales bacterium]